MNRNSILVVLLVVFGGVAMRNILRYLEIKTRNASVGDRRTLAADEIYDQSLSEQGVSKESFIKAWNRVGELLDIDSGLLRVDDKLDELLGVPKWIGTSGFTGVDDLIAEAETHLKATSMPAPKSVATLRDIIVILAR